MRSKLLKLTVTGAAAAILPFGVATIGAAPASAKPTVCVSGPYGMVHACAEAPGWHGKPHKNWKKHAKKHYKHRH